MRFVVDTNVAVVANGGAVNVRPDCRLATIDFLEQMIAGGVLVLDLDGAIEEEYKKNLGFGQPGVGNRFLQHFLTTAAKRVERLAILKDKKGNYSDFPPSPNLKKFDPSDRKFAALARKSKAPVANATDTDWLQHRLELAKYDVVIEFVCGEHSGSWFV